MCGLFGGVSNTLSGEEKEFIYYLGLLASFRGLDSTGVYITDGRKDTKVIKSVSSSGYFLTEGFEEIFGDRKSLIMGHARSKTMGENSVENAHPHEFGHIVGCHNGTINYLQHESRSDSSLFFERLSKENPIELLKEVDTKNGAYAITWVNKENNTLNFARNSKRPLFVAHSPGQHTIYWSSESEMLTFVERRTKPIISVPSSVPVDCIMTFDLNNISKEPVYTRFHNIVVEKKEVAHSSSGPSTFLTRVPNNETLKETTKSSTQETDERSTQTGKAANQPLRVKAYVTRTPRDSNLKPRKKPSYAAFKHYLISVEDAKKFLSLGCGNCGSSSGLVDATFWFSEDTYICWSCFTDESNKPFINMLLNEYGTDDLFYRSEFPVTAYEYS